MPVPGTMEDAGTTATTSPGSGNSSADANTTPSNLVDSAKQTAGQVAGQVREQAASRANQQKESAAAGLAGVAEAVRRMGEGLRQADDQTPVARYAAQYGDALAVRIENAASYLRGHDLGELVNDLEGYARRNPAYFLAGAFLVGFAGARFLKSSRPTPEFLSNLPDPNRALPAASTTATNRISNQGPSF